MALDVLAAEDEVRFYSFIDGNYKTVPWAYIHL
jgi:hypothetical protein